jgi:hypothetical protein
MANRDEPQKSVQASTPSQHSRFRRWAVRRARQLGIVVLFLAGILAVGAGCVMLRRATCLIGLPNVGGPFDVAAFRTFRVAEDHDAFALFRQAANKLRPMPNVPMAVRQAGSAVGWSKSDPKLREWLEANLEALSLFRQGAERADAMPRPLINALWHSMSGLHLGEFGWLALLEASRLEARGDMAAAWGWYRTMLRTKVHMTRRGVVLERWVINQVCRNLEPRIAAWASDHRTDTSLLRRALEDAHAGEPQPEWDLFSLKLDFLCIMNELERPDGWVWQGAEEDRSIRIAGEPLPLNLAWSIYAARRFILNEPERSRRVLRLFFVNWLAHCEDATAGNRRPAIRATFRVDKRNTSVFFYPAAPRTPAAARVLAPQELANWLSTTRDAKLLLSQWPWPAIRISERRQHRALVVLLAEELYRRDRGPLPSSEAALVGPYLDHLPDDGSEEVDDGTAPTIGDSAASPLGKPQ